MAKVSVCIPSYNHANYIKDTIKSVLNQSFQDFEIIISDDSSKDGTIEAIKEFEDDRIKLIENKTNNGPSINTNIAIKNASGEFISGIASDDVMERDRLKKTLSFLTENQNCGVVFTYAQTINDKNEFIDHEMMGVFNKTYESRYQLLNHFFYNGNFICGTTALTRRSVLEEMGGFDPCLWQLQDFDMWIKILIGGYDIGFIKEKLTLYRVGDNLSNISGGNDVAFLSRIYFEIQKVLENFLKIKDIEFFVGVFPKVKDKYTVISGEYIPFYIMNEAIEIANSKNNINSDAYRNFAISIAYNLINSKMREEIQNNFGFGLKNFLELISDSFLMQSYSNQCEIKNSCKKSLTKRISAICKKIVKKLRIDED